MSDVGGAGRPFDAAAGAFLCISSSFEKRKLEKGEMQTVSILVQQGDGSSMRCMSQHWIRTCALREDGQYSCERGSAWSPTGHSPIIAREIPSGSIEYTKTETHLLEIP